MNKLGTILVLIALASLAFGCSDDSVSVADVYDRMLESMTEEGSVLHSTMSFEVVDADGMVISSGEREFWIDVGQDVYREELTFFNSEDLPDTIAQIYTGGEIYGLGGPKTFASPRGNGNCAGSDSQLLFEFLQCITLAVYSEEQQDPRIEGERTFDGKNGIVVRFSLPSFDPEAPQDELFVVDLFVDPDTYLPIARVFLRLENGAATEGGQTHVYSHEFLPNEELPSDLFDPGPTVEVPTGP